jgi:hypothetical protein
MQLPQCAAQLGLSHLLWLRMLSMLRWPGCFADIEMSNMWIRSACEVETRHMCGRKATELREAWIIVICLSPTALLAREPSAL